MFRIILVLDLLSGLVVHGIKGERDKYKSIHHFSKIVDSSKPEDVIMQIRPKEVYIADLNRLMGSKGNNKELIKSISSFCKTMLDYGVKNLADLNDASKIASNVILGSETASLDLIERASKFDITVSVDIKNNSVISCDRNIESNPLDFIKILNDFDLKNLIILNMDAIGTKKGIDRDFLLNVSKTSKHQLILGGGIKNLDDIKLLKEIGFSGALVATAIHDGSIPLELVR